MLTFGIVLYRPSLPVLIGACDPMLRPICEASGVTQRAGLVLVVAVAVALQTAMQVHLAFFAFLTWALFLCILVLYCNRALSDPVKSPQYDCDYGYCRRDGTYKNNRRTTGEQP